MPGLADSDSKKDRRRQVDIPGMLSFALTATSGLLLSDLVAKGEVFQNPLAIAFSVSFGIFGAIFVLIQGYWAPRPLIPLPLVASRRVGPSLAIQTLTLCAQFTVQGPSVLSTSLLTQNSSSQTLPPTLPGLRTLPIRWRLFILRRPPWATRLVLF